jgi:hypothetical protein
MSKKSHCRHTVNIITNSTAPGQFPILFLSSACPILLRAYGYVKMDRLYEKKSESGRSYVSFFRTARVLGQVGRQLESSISRAHLIFQQEHNIACSTRHLGGPGEQRKNTGRAGWRLKTPETEKATSCWLPLRAGLGRQ